MIITLASAATAVAGLTGIRDNIVRFDGAAPNVPVKIALGILLFLVTLFTAITRWQRSQFKWRASTVLPYLAAFVGSFGLAAVLGFLGGVILYGM